MAVRADTIDPEALAVIVTPMRRRHLRGVLRLESQVYPRPWSIGLFMSELALRGSRVYLVARIGTEVAGYAGLMTVVGEGHITNIAVDPYWHRHKIGTRLLLALARQGIARGMTALTLEVRMSNEAAQAMYRQFGFAPAGMRKNYYADNEDALVMWAHDVDKPEYGERLAAIEATVPGTTLLENLW
ncbi:MAG: ribosomal protein S18-alanine N-acetyltransferase [Acidimicrobiales bacterium]